MYLKRYIGRSPRCRVLLQAYQIWTLSDAENMVEEDRLVYEQGMNIFAGADSKETRQQF